MTKAQLVAPHRDFEKNEAGNKNFVRLYWEVWNITPQDFGINMRIVVANFYYSRITLPEFENT